MIFDTLAAVVERYIPNLRPSVDAAKLFIFPGPAHEMLPKEYSLEEQQLMVDKFFLPFPKTAVEDPATCTILIDETPNQEGLNNRRRYIDCVDLKAPSSAFRQAGVYATREDEATRSFKASLPPKSVIVNVGLMWDTKFLSDKNQFFTRIEVLHAGIFSPDHGVIMEYSPDMSDLWNGAMIDAGNNTLTAIQQILYFNTPSRFVVEETPTRALVQQQRKKGKKAKAHIRRTHQRPIYTLLTPKEIFKKMRLTPAVPTGRTVTPHWRRKHYRLLSDPRYTKMRGRTITVKAAWVGPEEKVVGNKRYKVLLDK